MCCGLGKRIVCAFCLVMETLTYTLLPANWSCVPLPDLVCRSGYLEALLALEAPAVMQAVTSVSGFVDKGHGNMVGFYSLTLAGMQRNLVLFQAQGGCREIVNSLFLFFSCLPSLCFQLSIITGFLH